MARRALTLRGLEQIGGGHVAAPAALTGRRLEGVEDPLVVGSGQPVARREAPRRDLKLTLIGVILQPDRQYALVQRPGKKEALRLARGEKIDGWQVDGILPDRVVLSQAKEVVELELKDAKIKRPKVKRRQPRSAEAQDRRQSTAANPALRRQVPAQGQQRPEDDEGEEELPANLRRALQQETQ